MKKISRKKAIKKSGYALLTASTLIFLTPKASASGSTENTPPAPGSERSSR